MTVRAIKLQQVGSSNSDHYWSIHEFDADCAVAPNQGSPVACGDQAKWVETASKSNSDAPKGTDQNLGSRWSTGSQMQAGDSYTVDFAQTVNLGSLTLNNSQTSSNDFPAAFDLYGSADGKTFDSTPFASGTGAANLSTVSFATRSLRAVRVQIKTPNANKNYWSIGEFQPTCF
jgi:hypothetical protein